MEALRELGRLGLLDGGDNLNNAEDSGGALRYSSARPSTAVDRLRAHWTQLLQDRLEAESSHVKE